MKMSMDSVLFGYNGSCMRVVNWPIYYKILKVNLKCMVKWF